MWHVSTHTYVVLENIAFSTKALLILLMSAFFLQKNQRFLARIVPLLKAIVLEFWFWSYNYFLLQGIDQKSNTPPSEFCLISGDGGDLGIPNLALTFLIKCY